MARAGRKRKPAVARHPCGKVRIDARERQPDPTGVAKAYRIARGATEANWKDDEHETPFGRLYLAGTFSSPTDPDQAKAWYQAGLWFGGLWRAMRSAIAAQPPHARSPGGATAAKGAPPGESDLLRSIARHRAVERFLTRHEVMAIWEIIMVEREVTPQWLVPHLLSGLPKLVAVRERGTTP